MAKNKSVVRGGRKRTWKPKGRASADKAYRQHLRRETINRGMPNPTDAMAWHLWNGTHGNRR